MTAQQAIGLLRYYRLTKEEKCEIADLIERLQACQACEKQSNQFFGKCEGCEVAKE